MAVDLDGGTPRAVGSARAGRAGVVAGRRRSRSRARWPVGAGLASFAIFTMHPGGDPTAITGRGQDFDPTWSPDGKRIAYSGLTGDNRDIWVVDAMGGNAQRLTRTAPTTACRRGRRTVRDRLHAHARQRRRDRDHERRRGPTSAWCADTSGDNEDPDWSPDGTRVAYTHYDADSSTADIWTMDALGGNAAPARPHAGQRDPADVVAGRAPDRLHLQPAQARRRVGHPGARRARHRRHAGRGDRRLAGLGAAHRRRGRGRRPGPAQHVGGRGAEGRTVAANLQGMASPPDSEHRTIAPLVGPDDPHRFTDSGIEVDRLYTEDDLPPDLELGEPGAFPFTRGVHPDMYRKQLWTMRQYAGYATRAGVQRALPLPARARLDRAVDGLRPADAARPRLRQPALPGRGRPHRRGHRHARRHAGGLRPDPARPGLDLDDHQRAGQRAAVPVPARGRGAGRAVREAARHDPERHPQGVHRPRELHLPARGVDAADHRPLRLLQGERARAGTRSPSRATTSARRGARRCRRSRSRSPTGSPTCRRRSTPGSTVDEFAPRLSFFFNGHNNVFQEVAKFRAARRMWAHIMRDRFGATDERADEAALPHADRRRDADGPAADQQRGAGGAAGLRRGAAAARSRCTPTATTRRWRCPPSGRPSWRCARSRSSATSPGRPTASTRSRAPTSSSR